MRSVIGAAQHKQPVQPFCIVLPSRYRFMRQHSGKQNNRGNQPSGIVFEIQDASWEGIPDDHGE